MNLGWRESYSSISSSSEESEDLGHHSIDSLDDCTDIKLTAKETAWVFPGLWHHMLDMKRQLWRYRRWGEREVWSDLRPDSAYSH